MDTNPALTYKFAKQNDQSTLKYFSLDRYSGKVVLKSSLDFESVQELKLKITASDQAHQAQTTLTIKVTDVNDNPPVFSQSAYHATLPDGHSTNLIDLLTLNTTDLDYGENSRVKYSILNPTSGFSIGMYDGVLRVNQSNVTLTNGGDFQLTIRASDMGSPSLHSLASVRVKVNGGGGVNFSTSKKDYRLRIPEDTALGTVLLHLKQSEQGKSFYIVEGNEEGTFEVSNPSGVIVLVKELDREHQDVYNLKLTAGEVSSFTNITTIDVHFGIDDANDNAPVFKQSDYEVTISESTKVGSSIGRINAFDADLPDNPNSEISYDITSGNDIGYFRLNSSSGILSVNKALDYDEGFTEHVLVVRACDHGTVPLCTLNTFQINLEDSNDNAPSFPVSEYLEFVEENEPIGTAVFTAHATDLDKGIYGSVNYTTVGLSSGGDESWKLFNVDQTTGVVTTNVIFDYEIRNRYVFVLKASDLGGKSSTVKVRVEIESKDEFHPQFTEKTYRFTLAVPPSGSLPVGYVVGHVTATDRDKGPDGRVVYQLTTQHHYFKVNRTTGAILVKKKFDSSELLKSGRDVSLVVTASSGRQGSLTNMAVVEITLDPLGDPSLNLAINRDGNATVAAANNGIADWALGLLIALVLLLTTFGAVFVFLHMKNKRSKKVNKPNLSSETVSTANNYVDPSAFDTIPIRGSGSVVGGGNNQFAPPKYDEIPPYGQGHAASSNSGAATTSELSGSEQSGSSGRGSAEDGEDGEDEEIRMINEGPLQRDSGKFSLVQLESLYIKITLKAGIHRRNDDEDNLSDVSVRNTQEYLARLGIVNNTSTGVPQAASRLCSDPRAGSSKETLHHHHQTVPLDSLHIYDEEGNADNEISNFYAKLNDVAGSDRASSTANDPGVNQTLATNMDHVIAMGSYGEVPPVTHQPSMNGSLSSIVHSEEELAGSYNWDYLLDWGPQYQPLAHVFSEIARLKDDTASVQSAASGNSSVKSKSSVAPSKVPPPLITSVAPRAIPMPVLNSRNTSHHANAHNQMIMLPRSPINHDASGTTFSTSAAMSPSFSPSLSPLATKSPSISPLVTPGLSAGHHMMRQGPQSRTKTVVDAELRL